MSPVPPAATPSAPAPTATTVSSVTAGGAPAGPSGLPDATAGGFSGERALADVRWLAGTIGSRPTGKENERRAAEGMAARLRDLGYETRLESFPIRYFEDNGSSLRVDGEAGRGLKVLTLQFSAAGKVAGRLVHVGLGRPDDLAGHDLTGAIALIERGEITFGDKARNVTQAGAIGAVVYNREPGLFQGGLTGSVTIPAVALSREDGQVLVQRLRGGETLAAELGVNAAVVDGTSQNVVATLKGESDRTVVLGGHYDSVAEGPGANDNASGTATALELARVLKANPTKLTVRIVLFGAEEIGLVGSRAHVKNLAKAERERVVAMLNFDMVGVGDRPSLSGASELLGLVGDVAARDIVRLSRSEGGRGGGGSDHASFLEAGIPAVFFYRADDPRYHSPEDRAEFVDARNLEQAARLALALIERLG